MTETAPADETVALEAWNELGDRLRTLGKRVGFDDDFPGDPDDRVKGLAHLAEQAACWTTWSVMHGDPRYPRFYRQNDLVTPWGGPNADNVYRHARIDPSLRYRIRGRMHSCEQFLLAIRAGFMHQQTWGTLHQVSASELGIGEGEEFELYLGNVEGDTNGAGDGAGVRWIPIPDGAVTVSIREYYFDWRPEEPATFTIECLDDVGLPSRLDDATFAARIRAGAGLLDDSIEYWNRYLDEHRSSHVDNSFAQPQKLAKGLAAARYRFCFWELEPDQALIVTSTVPDAEYWSLQLYEMGTFELIDPEQRQGSLNHRQATIDDDRTLRVVLSDRDPGVANWLDTGARRCGLLTVRWFWPRAETAPELSTTVIPVTAVDGAMPPVSRRMNAAERAASLAARRAHLAWRFRT